MLSAKRVLLWIIKPRPCGSHEMMSECCSSETSLKRRTGKLFPFIVECFDENLSPLQKVDSCSMDGCWILDEAWWICVCVDPCVIILEWMNPATERTGLSGGETMAGFPRPVSPMAAISTELLPPMLDETTTGSFPMVSIIRFLKPLFFLLVCDEKDIFMEWKNVLSIWHYTNNPF